MYDEANNEANNNLKLYTAIFHHRFASTVLMMMTCAFVCHSAYKERIIHTKWAEGHYMINPLNQRK